MICGTDSILFFTFNSNDRLFCIILLVAQNTLMDLNNPMLFAYLIQTNFNATIGRADLIGNLTSLSNSCLNSFTIAHKVSDVLKWHFKKLLLFQEG